MVTDRKKLSPEQEQEILKKLNSNQIAIDAMEKYIPKDDLVEMKQTYQERREWVGAERCLALFKVWSRLKEDVESLSGKILIQFWLLN